MKNMYLMHHNDNLDEDEDELIYQHLQFRRIEKFMNNYIDFGQVINQKKVSDTKKLVQEVSYQDKSKFCGTVL